MGDREEIIVNVTGIYRSEGIIGISGNIKDQQPSYFAMRIVDNDKNMTMLLDAFGLATEQEFNNITYKDISEDIKIIRTKWELPATYYTYGTFVGKSGSKYHMHECFDSI